MGRPKLTEQYCIQRLEEKGYKFIEWSESFKGSLTKAHIVLHCGHISTGDYTSLVRIIDTKICMACAQYNRRVPASVRIEQIESKGIVFLNWVGEYESLKTKVQTKCNKGHISTYELGSILCKGCICQRCAIENLPGGYCEANFAKDESLKTHQSILYVLHITSTSESFYKVGITTGNKARVEYDLTRNYKVSVLAEIKMMLYDAFTIEQCEITKCSRYIPNYKFAGHTECMVELTDTLKGFIV